LLQYNQGLDKQHNKAIACSMMPRCGHAYSQQCSAPLPKRSARGDRAAGRLWAFQWQLQFFFADVLRAASQLRFD